jgi:hypothetical protein
MALPFSVCTTGLALRPKNLIVISQNILLCESYTISCAEQEKFQLLILW